MRYYHGWHHHHRWDDWDGDMDYGDYGDYGDDDWEPDWRWNNAWYTGAGWRGWY